MSASPTDVTRLLAASRDGDAQALDRLYPLVYDELRRIARRERRRGASETLNTTGLVHEAYLKLAGSSSADWNDRAHFYALAATVMRQITVNHARDRSAQKRGGGEHPVTLEPGLALALADTRSDAILALEDALTELAAEHDRAARIVELRFFVGLTIDETADVLSVSSATARRDWTTARAWLYERIRDRLN